MQSSSLNFIHLYNSSGLYIETPILLNNIPLLLKKILVT